MAMPAVQAPAPGGAVRLVDAGSSDLPSARVEVFKATRVMASKLR
jgi:hypothetical protein